MTLTGRARRGLLCDPPQAGPCQPPGPARAEAGVDAGTAVRPGSSAGVDDAAEAAAALVGQGGHRI
jgi:hypothetical protein